MTRKRFVILDAMRGIAGLVVPLFHLFEPLGHRANAPIETIVGHGYLAVEFFLLLMGYMLGYAYDRRWQEGMNTFGFFKRRLVRLHPLVVSGVILGLVVFFLQPTWGTMLPAIRQKGGFGVFGLALWAMTMVPVIGYGLLNPFNACSWTLYFEYAGNILYCFVMRRMGKVWLLIGALVGAFFWLTLAFHVNLNGLFGSHVELFDRVARHGSWTVAGGWSANETQCYIGFVRLVFPLFFGLLLSRLGWRIRMPKCALWFAIALFIAILFTPYSYQLGGAQYRWVNALFEALALMVVFPVLLLIGVGSEAKCSNGVEKAFTFLAELSYPFYMSHYMFMAIYNPWAMQRSGAFSTGAILLIVCILYVLFFGLATLVMFAWDRPIQRRLRRFMV